ncbi:MAG: hypothetical protein ABIP42_03745, partial [Planctomycetota bacterium]
LPLLLLQDPLAPAIPVKPPPADPRDLFVDWARRLEKAPVIHLQAEGVLVSADKQHPEISVRWTFATEIWMAKGGKVNAKTRWTGPRPEQGEPETFTAIALSNGLRSWQGFEGPKPLEPTDLTTPRFVPYPLPEIFGLFDGKLETDLPTARVSLDFDWGKPVTSMPTVIVVDPLEPTTGPAFWYGFAERELAGWCAMSPEKSGGDVVRGKLRSLEWLERLPLQDPPRFEPKAD